MTLLPSSDIVSLYLSEQFQFVSQRHRGYPFSATLYANGVMVARISSCCEYRYAPGFQQGRKGCFRLTWLAGGIPCHRSDFILWETDSVSSAENEKLVPVKTDWVNPLLCRYSVFVFQIGCILHGMRERCWYWYRGGNMESWWNTFFIFSFYFRCTSLRNKYSSCQKLKDGTKESLIPPLEQSPGNSTKPGSERLIFPFLPKALFINVFWHAAQSLIWMD